MAYYVFDQNNINGVYLYDGNRGISKTVYIEADSPSEANWRAREIGLDFSSFCSCCGYRWADVDELDTPVHAVPSPEAPFVIDEEARFVSRKQIKDGYETFVHPRGIPFYGTYRETKIINKLVYDGTYGYGVRVWDYDLEEPYAVNQRGYSEDDRWAPYPEQRWDYSIDDSFDDRKTVCMDGTNVVRVEALRSKGNDGFGIFWFSTKELADKFVLNCNVYLDHTPRPKLVNYAFEMIEMF